MPESDRCVLLSEVSEGKYLGRILKVMGCSTAEGIQRHKAATVFFLFAALVWLLSWACHADVMVVRLTSAKNPPANIEFGYGYQLDAGPMYLLCAPLIMFFGLWALEKFQTVLVGLCQTGQIIAVSEGTAKDEPDEQGYGACHAISAANRRVFNKVLLTAFVLSTLYAVFFQEFPPGNDRQKLMFGFMQADYVGQYKKGPIDAEDNIAKGRDIGWPVSAVLGPTKDLNIESVENAPRGKWQVRLFYLFVVLALSLQALFAIAAWWIFLKIVFFCALIAVSVRLFALQARGKTPSKSWTGRTARFFLGTVILLKLDPADEAKRFGLSPVIDGFRRIGLFLFPLGLAGFLAVAKLYSGLPDFDWAEAKKLLGSANIPEVFWRVRGQAGVFLMALATLLLIVALYIYLTIQTELCRDDVWEKDASIDQRRLREQELALKLFAELAFPTLTIAALSIVLGLIASDPDSKSVKVVIALWRPVVELMGGVHPG